MQTSVFRGPLFRGLAIFLFFTVVALVLIPIYVQRPAFIPGFAPPPDMWPRTVSIIGAALGLLDMAFALTGRAAASETIDKDGAHTKSHLLRFLGVLLAFAGFLALVPFIGFLVASMALTLAAILLTGERSYRFWIAALSVLGPILLVSFFHSALGTQFPLGALAKSFGF
ncbi:tripartite tricarboxylate transporter TctB family protein [Thioclava sp. 15-R06ZXC-3]|uniref:Tripartite tricarboxylate transporter TctB family protein n=1 Tax=Thioclava arctica TaxID=3238301 RepID=A0ABV3TQ63_9RHOB